MHYKNGRPASEGEWVVGPTHNSNGHPRVGLVLELMPGQGNCNVRLFCPRLVDKDDESGGKMVWLGKEKKPVHVSSNFEDYADVSRLILCADGHRLACALELGDWKSSFMLG